MAQRLYVNCIIIAYSCAFSEPLTHNLLTSHSFFSKHSSTLISAVRDGFISVGKDAPGTQLP